MIPRPRGTANVSPQTQHPPTESANGAAEGAVDHTAPDSSLHAPFTDGPILTALVRLAAPIVPARFFQTI